MAARELGWAPTPATTPTNSCPKTTGGTNIGCPRFRVLTSVAQTPAISTLTNASPGPGSGVGNSSITSRPGPR